MRFFKPTISKLLVVIFLFLFPAMLGVLANLLPSDNLNIFELIVTTLINADIYFYNLLGTLAFLSLYLHLIFFYFISCIIVFLVQKLKKQKQ